LKKTKKKRVDGVSGWSWPIKIALRPLGKVIINQLEANGGIVIR
jgi:hypothetical protein